MSLLCLSLLRGVSIPRNAGLTQRGPHPGLDLITPATFVKVIFSVSEFFQFSGALVHESV